MKLSISILSYNRPLQLNDLLNSIDYEGCDEIEINICDDHSPRSIQIFDVVQKFLERSNWRVNFYQHARNLGYDETLYDLVEMSTGEWIVFMGDDDFFVPGALKKYLSFLHLYKDKNLGYVMKSHYNINKLNKKEYFRYYKETIIFQPGEESCIALFRKSVFISGFLIRTDLAKKYNTHDLDGTLLLQLYLLARVVLERNAAYFSEFFTYQYTYNIYENSEVMYDRKKEKFIERVATIEISLNFLESYLKVLAYIDSICSIKLSKRILLDISKYSYPSLAIQRHLGVIQFTIYCLKLRKMGFSKSTYFYVYYLILLFFGAKLCDKLIYGLRNALKVTPSL